MSVLSKLFKGWKLGQEGNKLMSDKLEPSIPPDDGCPAKTSMYGQIVCPKKEEPIAKYKKSVTASKGAVSSVVAGVVGYAVIALIASLRAAGSPLIVWDVAYDQDVAVGIIAFLLGGFTIAKNIYKQSKKINAPSVTPLVLLLCGTMVVLSMLGCHTTLGAGGLSISTDANAANVMAPSVISISKNIAEIMAKLSQQKSEQEQLELSIKLKAQQQRLETIMQFIGSASGAK